ncbi:hypothetical protein SeMB42_g00845 [Synchytrium endobioticum]|uniref:Chromatin modification-related protein EAF7 n=1 Tax=Synchytrium endobioticum TaxID=286115 RepID=A0A507DNS2_9FUNG|nr:hypothetical protein SeLEV6574_g01810 [Synchytrium endobioticum]TPX53369.1 hypothetical protein SeMB42_g00845 [Synchytrium endobioticum]
MPRGQLFAPLHTAPVRDSPANDSDDGLSSPVAASRPSSHPQRPSGPDWTAPMEIALFHAIAKYKPVGGHKHFRMINIHRFYNSNSPVPMSISRLWEHLESMYNFPALDERAGESDDDLEPAPRTPSVSTPVFTNQLPPKKPPSEHIFKTSADFTLPPDEYEEFINNARRAAEDEEAATSAAASAASTPMLPPSIAKPETPTITTGRGRKRKGVVAALAKQADEDKAAGAEDAPSSRATSPMTETSIRSSPEPEEDAPERPKRKPPVAAHRKNPSARFTKASSNTSPMTAAAMPEAPSPNRATPPAEEESGSTRRATRSAAAAAAREAAAHSKSPTPAGGAHKRSRKGRG